MLPKLALTLITFAGLFMFISARNRNFTISFDQNCFLKDGECFQYIGGSMHYVRVPHQYWEDRLLKMRAAGLTVVQTYIPWNVHELQPGVFDFTGNANISLFLSQVSKLGLYVILRAGPFMDAEWEMGGFPWWLLKLYPDIKLRTSDSRYIKHVVSYYQTLFPIINPFLYNNGGSVVAIQVENEYGSYYACDKNYTGYLRDLFHSLTKNKVQLITTDGAAVSYLKCGAIEGVYATVDFGTEDDTEQAFAAQRIYSPRGPLVNSEFYPGHHDIWGEPHSTVAVAPITKTMHYMWNAGASFNFYMFEGGSNFGYTAGAEGWTANTFQTVPTSYDFDAPLSEAGDITDKYYAVRQTVEMLTNTVVRYPIPANTPKSAYGNVTLTKLGSIIDMLGYIVNASLIQKSKYPVTAEAASHGLGFLLYETILPKDGSTLVVPGVNDRGYIILNEQMLVGKVQRPYNSSATNASFAGYFKRGDKLQILVENQGRKCVGTYINDSKGMQQNVTLDEAILTDWSVYPIDLSLLESLDVPLAKEFETRAFNLPSLYAGVFSVTSITDTYFDPTNWTKGQVLINKNNIGRYWPQLGPQVRLYVPKHFLGDINEIILLELEAPGNSYLNGFNVSFSNEQKLSMNSKQVKVYNRNHVHQLKQT